MKLNIGSLDRRVRIVAGLSVLAAGWYFGSYWGLLGLILLATATIQFCPLYLPFGISTRKGK
jgi:hypothetical protein